MSCHQLLSCVKEYCNLVICFSLTLAFVTSPYSFDKHNQSISRKLCLLDSLDSVIPVIMLSTLVNNKFYIPISHLQQHWIVHNEVLRWQHSPLPVNLKLKYWSSWPMSLNGGIYMIFISSMSACINCRSSRPGESMWKREPWLGPSGWVMVYTWCSDELTPGTKRWLGVRVTAWPSCTWDEG